ncbi:U2 small nuclear ribonucleoprotein A' [Tanacetum coccineum]
MVRLNADLIRKSSRFFKNSGEHVLDLKEFLPQLHTLVLTSNLLDNFVEINPLASLPKLQYLSLLGNNITKKPNYRLYVIHKLKFLLLLDSKKSNKSDILCVLINCTHTPPQRDWVCCCCCCLMLLLFAAAAAATAAVAAVAVVDVAALTETLVFHDTHHEYV